MLSLMPAPETQSAYESIPLEPTISSSEPEPAPQPVFQTKYLEHPFAWKTESFYFYRKLQFFPLGKDLTISFSATRNSKIMGYIPFVGTVIGAHRIFRGFQEYQSFKNAHLHSLSQRSIRWISRGLIELIPLLGGVICLIIDIVATLRCKTEPNLTRLEDDTPCGYCHPCGYCKC